MKDFILFRLIYLRDRNLIKLFAIVVFFILVGNSFAFQSNIFIDSIQQSEGVRLNGPTTATNDNNCLSLGGGGGDDQIMKFQGILTIPRRGSTS